MLMYHAESEAEILGVHRLFHDDFFNVEDIRVGEGFVEFPYKRDFHRYPSDVYGVILSNRNPGEMTACTLRIGRVREYKIVDTEKIGDYDFSVIEYSETTGRLIIRTGLPITLEFVVDKLDVSVQIGTGPPTPSQPEPTMLQWLRRVFGRRSGDGDAAS